MNILDLSPELNTAIKAAEKTSRGWEIESGKTMGGDFYRELAATYGSFGIQVSMIGGGIIVTWESPAHADIEELHGQIKAGEGGPIVCDECKGDQDVRDFDNEGLWAEVEALCVSCREKATAAQIDDVRPNTILPAPVDGGGDPEGMNDQRRRWGNELAVTCMELTNTDSEDAVSDAIGYLLHVAAEYGETPARAAERAVLHFNDETHQMAAE